MKRNWDELTEGWPDASVQRLEKALKRYSPPPPSDAARQAALHAALAEMDKQQSGYWPSLWRQIKIEARFLPLWYYLASAAIALTGIVLLLSNRDLAAQIGLVAGFAPLPMLLGLLEVFHGTDEGMAEIEAACRYSPARVISARMSVIGILSLAIALLFGLCSSFDSAWMALGLVVIPYCTGSALGMLLATALQGRANSAQVALTIACVNGGAAMLLSTQRLFLQGAVPSACWALGMILSMAFFYLALRNLLTSCGKFYERSLLPWN